MPAISDEKEVRSITPTQRIITIAGVAGSLIAGGAIGATLAGPLAAAAANTSNSTQIAATAAPSAAAGTFKSNEDATHEKGETTAQEAAENSGQRPFGGGAGHPNETGTHEAGETTAREAAENAAIKATPTP